MNEERIKLDTLSKESLYGSIEEILQIDKKIIKDYIKENAENIVDVRYDEYSIEDMDLSKLLNGNRIKIIDTLIMHHITPRKCRENIEKEGLMTLANTLTSDTELANYLNQIGFTFEFDGNKIKMTEKGNVVDLDILDEKNLKKRLEGDDYNINGYLFVSAFNLNSIQGWLGSPEILKTLSNAYNKKEIANDYGKECENYYISFEVPTKDIDIDSTVENISEDDKSEILLKYAVNALAYAETEGYLDYSMCNPVIYLNKSYNVESKYIQKIWKLKKKNCIKYVPE